MDHLSIKRPEFKANGFRRLEFIFVRFLATAPQSQFNGRSRTKLFLRNADITNDLPFEPAMRSSAFKGKK